MKAIADIESLRASAQRAFQVAASGDGHMQARKPRGK